MSAQMNQLVTLALQNNRIDIINSLVKRGVNMCAYKEAIFLWSAKYGDFDTFVLLWPQFPLTRETFTDYLNLRETKDRATFSGNVIVQGITLIIQYNHEKLYDNVLHVLENSQSGIPRSGENVITDLCVRFNRINLFKKLTILDEFLYINTRAIFNAIEWGNYKFFKFMFYTHEEDNEYALRDGAFLNMVHAIKGGSVEIVKLMNERDIYDIFEGEDLNQINLLSIALENEQFPVAEYLFHEDVVLHSQELLEAAGNGKLNIVQFYINHGGDVRVHDDQALIYAVQGGNLDIVKLLVDSGIPVNMNNSDPLKAAVLYGHMNIVQYLLSKGESLVDKDREYPLFILAAKHGHLSIVSLFVQRYFDEIRPFVKEALKESSRHGHWKVFIYLVSVYRQSLKLSQKEIENFVIHGKKKDEYYALMDLVYGIIGPSGGTATIGKGIGKEYIYDPNALLTSLEYL